MTEYTAKFRSRYRDCTYYYVRPTTAYSPNTFTVEIKDDGSARVQYYELPWETEAEVLLAAYAKHTQESYIKAIEP